MQKSHTITVTHRNHWCTGIINRHKVLANALYQLVMSRFLECFADILYIPSGVDFYHAVKPNEKFGLLLL